MAAMSLTWFPQEYAHLFYAVKGCIALAATLLYLLHMNRAWGHLRSTAQRWRYMVLLYLSTLLTVATVEQIGDKAQVGYRNLGALIGTVLLLIAAVVSLREDRP